MGDAGKLCYKHGGSALCYKHGGSALVFKAEQLAVPTRVVFSWDANGCDLDICGYWLGQPDVQVGFGHLSLPGNYGFGAYHIEYSGDITSVGGDEWVNILISPWSAADAGERKFRIHFNFYEYDSEEYPTSVCTVVANQPGVGTAVRLNQSCGTANHSAPGTGSPYCTVVFDADGRLVGIE